MDESTLQKFRTELSQLLGQYPNIEENTKQSKMFLADGSMNETNNICCIDFEFLSCSAEQREEFSSLVDKELMIRGVADEVLMGKLVNRVSALRSFLKTEDRLKYLREQTEVTYEDAMILLEEAIPCILHLRNRTGEKMVKEILKLGIELRNNEKNKINVMAESVNQFLNEMVWGTKERKSQYKIPLEMGKGKSKGNVVLGDMTLPNYRVQAIVSQLERLIDICVVETQHPNENRNLKKCADLYQRYCEIMTQHHDYTDEAIENFQNLVDEFMQLWCIGGKIFPEGRRGMTNYFHMLSSGHIKFYMNRWRNLYRYEQEGWESLNWLIKEIFFRHTQHGGFKSYAKDIDSVNDDNEKGDVVKDNKKLSSRVEPIGRWVSRLILWRSGKAMEYLRNEQEED